MTADAEQLSVVDIPENCGNAPRKIVIRDFLIALYSRAADAVIATLQDDIQWQLVGSRTLSTAADVRQWLGAEEPVNELKLHTIITHGTDCGADGTIRHPDGSQSHFNHVIVFAGHGKNAKIKEIRSYIIDA
ncbi:nuclear transport factor 2 family protein [Yaniella flava]|uniref:Nuclear transport factor 2 family protein n=1 Tax=Yaniella flava TaxID=287930 RepID=A0ABN2UTY7_9MICC|nr:nuclear transport factor 2 family protein [Micrococcaceae bacterium]